MNTAVGIRRSRATRTARVHAHSCRQTALEVGALIAIVVLLVAGVVLTAGRPHVQGPTSRVFVEPGQTLWAIAAEHPLRGQTTEQTAQIIAELNGAHGGRVAEGTAITIPCDSSDQVLTASQ